MGIRLYFRGGRLARMSDGSYCIVRDLGLVKGGKGLKCHRTLLRLTPAGLVSKLVEAVRHAAGLPAAEGRTAPLAGLSGALEAKAAMGSAFGDNAPAKVR
jgi:hypothetical protein